MTDDRKGTLVVFEGPDATGKTELVREVSARFRSREYTTAQFAFPSRRPIGQLIRQAISGEVKINEDSLLHLYAADGIDNETAVIDCLKRGDLVLMDRAPTLGSAWVYQSERHPLTRITQVMDNDVRPDLVFILDVPAVVAHERLLARTTRDMFEMRLLDTEHYNTLRSRYAAFAVMLGAHIIDATQSLSEIGDEVERVILQHMEVTKPLNVE